MIALKRCYFLKVINSLQSYIYVLQMKLTEVFLFYSSCPSPLSDFVFSILSLCTHVSIHQSSKFSCTQGSFYRMQLRWVVLVLLSKEFLRPVGRDIQWSKECRWGAAAEGEPKTGCVSRQQTCTQHSVHASWQIAKKGGGGEEWQNQVLQDQCQAGRLINMTWLAKLWLLKLNSKAVNSFCCGHKPAVVCWATTHISSQWHTSVMGFLMYNWSLEWYILCVPIITIT